MIRDPFPTSGTIRPRRRAGMALVLVLAFLVLLSALIVAFFSSVQTDLQSSKSAEASASAKQLATTATNIVIGQVNDGTKSFEVPQPPGTAQSGTRLDWASQPGMIRTWDDGGHGWKIFKLYSSNNMVANFDDQEGNYSTSKHLTAEVPGALGAGGGWPTTPATFVDLNEPVLVPDVQGTINHGGTLCRASYPIIDPGALNDKVEGFSISNVPGYGGKLAGLGPDVSDLTNDPTKPPTIPGTTGNPAPMPVAWIYVLKDGTLSCPSGTADAGRTATFTAGLPSSPTQTNPIVGRLAFWTDDETCKLNLNTSSEPTPWDTPRAISLSDVQYGQYQPAKNEYQRFPGHPFMTALSPVLFPGNVKLTPQQKDAIYKIIPRVQPGGSESATVPVNVVNNTNTTIMPDSDRLFANVDEFLFENPGPSTTTPTPPRQSFAGDAALSSINFDTNRLRRARFFLTANSRAPEINLFGQPRVSLWPESATTANRTVFDQLAAFCTTMGASAAPQPFYFQRQDSTSPTADWNLMDAATGTKRNQTLYTYLQNTTGNQIPGFAGSFLQKWNVDRDQILTEIFDYVRTTNLNDPQLPTSSQYAVMGGEQNGQVAPILINTTKGFGRFHTVSQVGIHFICSQDGANGISTMLPTQQASLSPGQRAIEAAILIEPFSPSEGWYQLQENMYFDVTVSNMTVNGQSLRIPSHAGAPMHDDIGNGWHCNGRQRGGAGGLRGPAHGNFGGANYFLKTALTIPISPALTGSSGRPVVNGNAPMAFSGGTVTIGVYVGGSPTVGKLIQTINVRFPPGNFPVPSLVQTGTLAYHGCSPTDPSVWWTFADATSLIKTPGYSTARYQNSGATPLAPGTDYANPIRRWAVEDGIAAGFKAGCLFRKEDVVRSMVPMHGDIRLIAGQQTVPATEFVQVRSDDWSNPAYNFLHVFSEAIGTHTIWGNCNEPGPDPAPGIPGSGPTDQLHHSQLVTYHYSRMPEIRPGAGAAYNLYGDFDNGIAQSTDGAFINKPDEGNLDSTDSGYYYFAWDFAAGTPYFFAPNRLVPSAGMLGSLPTGVKRMASNPQSKLAWTTLLFRPQTGHPGNGVPVSGPPYTSPPDHLIMDLFWMPVCQPYAISEPFSTAGKINLNYEIAPFTYIRRTTALHGAMKSEQPLVIPNAASKVYKLWDHETNDYPFGLPNNPNDQDPNVIRDWTNAFTGQSPFDKMRLPIDVETTLSQADSRFKTGSIFRSATQICEMHLVRQGEQLNNYTSGNIWQNALVTGDNTRERPYANLYGRLTTRSNTYTVHIRSQALRQLGGPKSNDPAWQEWREGKDQKLSEYRGSNIIERYIDPADPALPNFTTDPAAVVDNAYRFRIVSSKKFTE